MELAKHPKERQGVEIKEGVCYLDWKSKERTEHYSISNSAKRIIIINLHDLQRFFLSSQYTCSGHEFDIEIYCN